MIAGDCTTNCQKTWGLSYYGIVIWMRLKKGYIPLYTFQMDVSEGVYDDEASNFGCSPKFSDKAIYVAVDGGNPAPPWMVETLQISTNS